LKLSSALQPGKGEQLLSDLFVVAGSTAVGVLTYWIIYLLEESDALVEQTEDKKEILYLSQISHTWQDDMKNNPPPVPPRTEPMIAELREPPIFCNQDIEDFYLKYVYNNYSIKQPEWAVICRILELLDKSGGCSSVVCVPDAGGSGY